MRSSSRCFGDPPACTPASQSLCAVLTGVQPAGEGQRAVLHIEGEVVNVQATGGHHLQGLVVLDLAVVPDIHVRDAWRLPHVHTGQGREAVWGLKIACKVKATFHAGKGVSPSFPWQPGYKRQVRNSGASKPLAVTSMPSCPYSATHPAGQSSAPEISRLLCLLSLEAP